MNYMLLLYSAPESRPADGSPEAAAEMTKWMSYTSDLADAGALVAGDPLYPVEAATSVRVRDGKTTTTDGPFAETKETLGGYYIIDVADLDAAITWAAKVPNVSYGTVEIRPIPVMPG